MAPELTINQLELNNAAFTNILRRSPSCNKKIENKVLKVIEDVRNNGDKALFRYMKLFDKVDVSSGNVTVSNKEVNDAIKLVSPTYKKAIKTALKHLTKFHQAQKPNDIRVRYPDGVVLEYRHTAIDSVCVNAPCDQAPLPSSALMNLVPATVSGVKDIYLISTPKQGRINENILYIAKLLDVRNVLRISGAQGMAAMAFGTESVPKVVKIVGPGGMYTQTAKKLLNGIVGIDFFAGPSEIAVIWDDDTPARFVASDLLSQIEHGSGYEMCVLFCNSRKKALAVQNEVAALIKEHNLPAERLRALQAYSNIFVSPSKADIAKAINLIAPEHVEILSRNETYYKRNIHNVGSMFVGPFSPEVVGDYFCGTNHILPTMGTAKFASGLGVKDFIKSFSVINYTKKALRNNLKSITELAEYEKMFAHALSARVRFVNDA